MHCVYKCIADGAVCALTVEITDSATFLLKPA